MDIINSLTQIPGLLFKAFEVLFILLAWIGGAMIWAVSHLFTAWILVEIFIFCFSMAFSGLNPFKAISNVILLNYYVFKFVIDFIVFVVNSFFKLVDIKAIISAFI